MFCIECGQKLPDNAKFCCRCGTAVNNISNTTPPIMDDVAARAEDVVITDEMPSSDVQKVCDEVEKKAILFGDFETSQPDTSITPLQPKSESRKLLKYEYIRENFMGFTGVYEIIRKDNETGVSSYCIEDKGHCSEWFERPIRYCGYDIFFIQKNGKPGLMHMKDGYQVWDHIKHNHYLYGVVKNGKYAIVSILNHKIEYLTDFIYDDYILHSKAVSINKSDELNDKIIIVKQNGKFGYLFVDYNKCELSAPIDCVLDYAKQFTIEEYDDPMAKIGYKGADYLLDEKFNLWKKQLIVCDGFLIWHILFSLGGAVFLSTLFTMILDGCSWDEAYNGFEHPEVFLISLCVLFFIIAIWSKRAVPVKNITLPSSDKKKL